MPVNPIYLECVKGQTGRGFSLRQGLQLSLPLAADVGYLSCLCCPSSTSIFVWAWTCPLISAGLSAAALFQPVTIGGRGSSSSDSTDSGSPEKSDWLIYVTPAVSHFPVLSVFPSQASWKLLTPLDFYSNPIEHTHTHTLAHCCKGLLCPWTKTQTPSEDGYRRGDRNIDLGIVACGTSPHQTCTAPPERIPKTKVYLDQLPWA